MNYGGPAEPGDCEAYLRNIFSDPDLIPIPGFIRPLVSSLASRRRAPILRANYQAMGRMSPILEQTEGQARELEKRLGEGFSCFVGMRYWRPFIADAIGEIRERGFRRLVLLPLYPQECAATTGSCLNEAGRAMAAAGYAPEVSVVRSFCQMPGFVGEMARSTGEVLQSAGGSARVLFCAHGLPERVARKDPYPSQVVATVEGISGLLEPPALHRLAWQSKVGPVKWLEPPVERALEEYSAEGVKEVVLVPVSFVSEHSETLYELDILYAGEAKSLGMNVWRVPTVRSAAAFIDGLAELVLGSLENGK